MLSTNGAQHNEPLHNYLYSYDSDEIYEGIVCKLLFAAIKLL